MSLIKERRGNEFYYTFQMGAGKKLYLGPEERPDPDRVERAMNYVKGRIEHYSHVLHELEAMLPEEDRRRLRQELPEETEAYLTKLLEKLPVELRLKTARGILVREEIEEGIGILDKAIKKLVKEPQKVAR